MFPSLSQNTINLFQENSTPLQAPPKRLSVDVKRCPDVQNCQNCQKKMVNILIFFPGWRWVTARPFPRLISANSRTVPRRTRLVQVWTDFSLSQYTLSQSFCFNFTFVFFTEAPRPRPKRLRTDSLLSVRMKLIKIEIRPNVQERAFW